jgi:hypothetical protein
MEEQQLKITTPMMLWFSIVAVPLKQLDKGGRYEDCSVQTCGESDGASPSNLFQAPQISHQELH